MSKQGLIRFCSPVIKLYGELLWMENKLTDTSELYDELFVLISALEIDLEDSAFPKTVIKECSYSLCCVLDSVMCRVKGVAIEALPENESLLSSIHNEVIDSSKLPKLARKLVDNKKSDNSELLGLLYVLLEMGYQERIPLSDESQEMLLSLEGDLAHKLAVSHKPMIKVIRNGLIPVVNTQKRRSGMPLWVSLSLVVLVLLSSHKLADLFLTKYYNMTIEKIEKSTKKTQ